MLSLLNKKYDQLGPNKFFKTASVVCFLSDIIVLYYVINFQLPKIFSSKIISLALSLRGIDPSLVNPGELALLMQSQMAFTFSCFLIFHLIIYTFAALQKSFPMKYVANYTFFGVLFTVIEVLLIFATDFSISIYTLTGLMGYFFVWYGYKKFFKKPEKQN